MGERRGVCVVEPTTYGSSTSLTSLAYLADGEGLVHSQLDCYTLDTALQQF
jgi:hypothetical protein